MRENIEEFVPVTVITEDLLPIIPPADDMIRSTGVLYPERS